VEALVTAVFLLIAFPGLVGCAWVVVVGTSMEPEMHTGDMVLVRRDGAWEVGDVVAYQLGDSAGTGVAGTVIHRLVSGNTADGWRSQGDNKPNPDPWTIQDSAIIGRQVLFVPQLGAILGWARSPIVLALAAGVSVAFWVAMGGRKPSPPPPFFFGDDEFDMRSSRRSRRREGRG
jgi:signal peptidase I